MARTDKRYRHYRGRKTDIASATTATTDAGEILLAWQATGADSPAELYAVSEDGTARPVRIDATNITGNFRITDVRAGAGEPWAQTFPIGGWTPDEGDVWINTSSNPPKHYIFKGGALTTQANWSLITSGEQFAPQSPNVVLAGPASGTAAMPTFRAIAGLLEGQNNSDCQIEISTGTDGRARITATVKTIDAGWF